MKFTSMTLTIFAIAVSGCASQGSYTPQGAKIVNVSEALSNGEIRLTCEVACSGMWGMNKLTQRVLYDNQLWGDLAVLVSNVGYRDDQGYYYLGRSAEGLGHLNAASTYYKFSDATQHKCDGIFNNCAGLNVPQLVQERLATLAEKIDTPPHDEKNNTNSQTQSNHQNLNNGDNLEQPESIKPAPAINSKTRTQELEKLVAKVPASNFEENIRLYKELLMLNPESKRYADKISYYEGKKRSKTKTLSSKNTKKTNFDPYSKISPDAVYQITQDRYPKTFTTWGETWINRINGLMQGAALKAASSSECDTVSIVDLSSKRSIPKEKIIFYVDCKNGKRFYISETEIKSAGTIVSKKTKTASTSDSEAINACQRSVKNTLQFPSSMDLGLFSLDVYRPSGGNIVITFDFEAKNRLGAELPYKARCVIDDQGIHSPEISPR